jgi:hypothetical protein
MRPTTDRYAFVETFALNRHVSIPDGAVLDTPDPETLTSLATPSIPICGPPADALTDGTRAGRLAEIERANTISPL